MSLTTYAGIRAAILDWSWTQGGLTDTIIKNDIFPQLWALIYWGDRTGGQQPIEPLRIRSMTTSGTLTPDTNGQVTISTGVSSSWLEFIEMTPTYSDAQSMNYLEPWTFRKQVDALAATSAPQFIYTVEGDSLKVAPKNTGTINAYWYAKFTALSDQSDTDWLVSNAPHVYLRGGLMLACDYTQDERKAQYRTEFAGAIKALNMTDQLQRASGSKPVARPRVVV